MSETRYNLDELEEQKRKLENKSAELAEVSIKIGLAHDNLLQNNVGQFVTMISQVVIERFKERVDYAKNQLDEYVIPNINTIIKNYRYAEESNKSEFRQL